MYVCMYVKVALTSLDLSGTSRSLVVPKGWAEKTTAQRATSQRSTRGGGVSFADRQADTMCSQDLELKISKNGKDI